MSNVIPSDFGGQEHYFEWDIDFPHKGEYIFRFQCDNEGTLYVDGEKQAEYKLGSGGAAGNVLSPPVSLHFRFLKYFFYFLYIFLDGTRVFYITIDLLKYGIEHWYLGGGHDLQAYSPENFVYRIFIQQCLKFFRSIQNIQNLISVFTNQHL